MSLVQKIIFDKMTAMRTKTISLMSLLYIDSNAFKGRFTPTTAFDGAI